MTLAFSRPSRTTRRFSSTWPPSVDTISLASENFAAWIFHMSNTSLANPSLSILFKCSTNISVSTFVKGNEKSRCNFARGGGSFIAAVTRLVNNSFRMASGAVRYYQYRRRGGGSGGDHLIFERGVQVGLNHCVHV